MNTCFSTKLHLPLSFIRFDALALYTALAVVTVLVWHSSICMGQREEILLLTLPHSGQDMQSGSGVRVRNLVLYLYTAPGSATVIERAAITEGTRNILGEEHQELVDLRGALFVKENFLKSQQWVRDVNFDGFPDLIVHTSQYRSSQQPPAYLYVFDPSLRRFRRDRDNAYALEPRLIYSRGRHS